MDEKPGIRRNGEVYSSDHKARMEILNPVRSKDPLIRMGMINKEINIAFRF
jgi:hypothetical protein